MIPLRYITKREQVSEQMSGLSGCVFPTLTPKRLAKLMTYKTNVGFVGFLDLSPHKKKRGVCASNDEDNQPMSGFFQNPKKPDTKTRHSDPQTDQKPDINDESGSLPEGPDRELSNDFAGFSHARAQQKNIYMGEGDKKPDIPDIESEIEPRRNAEIDRLAQADATDDDDEDAVF